MINVEKTRIFLVSLSTIFVSVNLSLPFGSSKRIGFVLLIICSLCICFKERVIYNNRNNPCLLLLFAMFFSAVVGILINATDPGVAILNLAFTCIVTILVKFNLDNIKSNNLDFFRRMLIISVLTMVCVATVSFLSISNFSLVKIISLRVLMLDSLIPVNSTMNQLSILFVLVALSMTLNKKYIVTVLLSSSLITIFIFILFSLSRQNILFITLLVSLFVCTRIKKVGFFFIILCITLTVSIFVGGTNSIDNTAISPLTSRLDRTKDQFSNQDYSRVKQFNDSLEWGLNSPFIGLGVGGFAAEARKNGYPRHNQVPEAALNQLISEHGIIFFMFFSVMYLILLINVFRSKADNNTSKSIFIVFMFSFPILFLFNEIHYQASFWVVYLVYFKLCQVKFHWRGKNAISV